MGLFTFSKEELKARSKDKTLSVEVRQGFKDELKMVEAKEKEKNGGGGGAGKVFAALAGGTIGTVVGTIVGRKFGRWQVQHEAEEQLQQMYPDVFKPPFPKGWKP
jgi:hypothetical protein